MTSEQLTEQQVSEALEYALSAYFEDCRKRVPAFVDRHFRYPGALATNSRALGWDLLRAPLNLFWAPFFVLISLLRLFCESVGWQRLAGLLVRVPGGFTTNIQTFIAEEIRGDLLAFRGMDNYSQIVIDRLAEREPGFESDALESLRPLIKAALTEYAVTRTASADITNAVSVAIIGALVWQKFTPGGFAVGLLVAIEISRMVAIDSFWLGETIGRVYYGIFPVDPSGFMQFLGILISLTLMSVFAAFSGFITDPLQSVFGLHKKRLYKMIDSIQRDYLAQTSGGYRPKDQYLARVMDSIDVIKSGLA